MFPNPTVKVRIVEINVKMRKEERKIGFHATQYMFYIFFKKIILDLFPYHIKNQNKHAVLYIPQFYFQTANRITDNLYIDRQSM